MSKIVECVPNFSEGIKKEVIDAISEAIKSTPGCSLLDVDPGSSTNRTVYTFVGGPDEVVNGAINGAKVAFKLIDMTKHKGEHPRMGAMDVCPFIPVKGVTMEDCVKCANKCAAQLAEIGIPSYLYGSASNRDYRKSIPQIRIGEYEALEEKLKKDEWKPDYGPETFVASWGASLIGARNFLIAYNVNLLATKEQAHRIALDIREQGRGPDQPGIFKCVQAIGWYLEEEDLAQVSINITDTTVTSIHEVFEKCLEIAKSLDLPVTGSQIVGLVPLDAILSASRYYMNKEKLFILNEKQKIKLVIDRLGLNSIGFFKMEERIVEYMVNKESDTPFLSMSVKNYVNVVASRSATPGGGCVAALCGSLGAGLSTMAGLLTYGNKKFEKFDEKIRRLVPPLYQIKDSLMRGVEEDATAFDGYMVALKLPKKTPEENDYRNKMLNEALLSAVNVPLGLIKNVNKTWATLEELGKIVNIACLSDVQVGIRCLVTGAWGGHYNVMANLKNMNDKEKAKIIQKESEDEVNEAVQKSEEILKKLDERYWKE